MAVKAPPGLLFWIPAGVLVLCTLVALWVTAAQIKARKMAARYGERIEADPAPDGRLPEFVLRPGQSTRVEHLTLDLDKADGSLVVLDARQRPLARYSGLKKGDERGWQELRIKVLAVDADSIRLATEFRPGAACLGPGRYTALRPGLHIELPGGRGATVAAWDPAKPEVRVHVGAEEITLTAGQARTVGGVRLALKDLSLELE
jgi:hypothetical protein